MKPGDVAVVVGAGTIGAMTALAALAGGASRVILADVIGEKLALFAGNPAVTTVNVREQRLADVVRDVTTGWGADVVFEASGNAKVYDELFDLLCPGGCAVLVGMPVDRVPLDVVAMQAKEVRLESVFRYANVFPRALALISSGMIDVKPFISRKFAFADGSMRSKKRQQDARPMSRSRSKWTEPWLKSSVEASRNATMAASRCCIRSIWKLTTVSSSCCSDHPDVASPRCFA